MGKIIKKFSLILSLLIFIIILSLNVFAVGLGVSPAELKFNNVLKGGYAQDSIFLSTDTPYNLSMFFEFNGDIKDWISVEGNLTNITVSRSSPQRVKIIVQPPQDTANGDYYGYMRVITDKIINPETGIGSAVKAAFMVKIYITITGDQIVACSGGGVGVSDAEIGFSNEVSATVKNEGNVRIRPDIIVDVWNKYQTNIVYSTILSSDYILPTESVKITKEVLTDLSTEQYWVEVKVPECGFSGMIPVSIVEKGGISDKGDLIRIENKAWAKTNEIIPITAYFKNSGERTVTAQFKGEVLYNGEIVKIIDTDKIDAKPGELIELQSFFKPENVGQYYVEGRIYYNNKITTKKASVLNVNLGKVSSDAISSVGMSIMWYVIILLFIGIMVMLILIKRKKHKTKAVRRVKKHH